MQVIEIICLANSRKHGGRCVAGLRTDGKGWVRPVAAEGDGALYPHHYRLQDGSEPGLLDVVRLRVAEPRPGPHHPEDWLVAAGPWRLMERPAGQEYGDILVPRVGRGPLLLGDPTDRISCDAIARRPLDRSLELVMPEKLSWQIRLGRRGNRQTRAVFALKGVEYNLSVSDPLCEARLGELPVGDHPRQAGGLAPRQRLWLTVSLTEPFEGCVYKLVAAVIVLPERPGR